MSKQYRIPRSDMVMAAPMPFNQEWQARVPVPISEIGDLGLALQAGYSAFMPGDKIEICSFEVLGTDWRSDDGRFRRFTESVPVRIVAKADNQIEAVAVGPVFHIPSRDQVVAPDDRPMLGVFQNRQGGFEVRDEAGNVIDLFVEREQAQEFADRENARSGSGTTIKRGYGKFEVRDEKTGALLREFPTQKEAKEFASQIAAGVAPQAVA